MKRPGVWPGLLIWTVALGIAAVIWTEFGLLFAAVVLLLAFIVQNYWLLETSHIDPPELKDETVNHGVSSTGPSIGMLEVDADVMQGSPDEGPHGLRRGGARL